MRTLLFLFALVICSSGFGQELEKSIAEIVKKYTGTKLPGAGTKIIKMERGGTLFVSGDCWNKRTGTIDSERGELSCKDLLVYYDIGVMSGTHMAPLLMKECTWYLETTFNGRKAFLGLKKNNGETELVITILQGSGEYIHSFPANFWTIIKTDTDIKGMLDIVSSYQPKEVK